MFLLLILERWDPIRIDSSKLAPWCLLLVGYPNWFSVVLASATMGSTNRSKTGSATTCTRHVAKVCPCIIGSTNGGCSTTSGVVALACDVIHVFYTNWQLFTNMWSKKPCTNPIALWICLRTTYNWRVDWRCVQRGHCFRSRCGSEFGLSSARCHTYTVWLHVFIGIVCSDGDIIKRAPCTIHDDRGLSAECVSYAIDSQDLGAYQNNLMTASRFFQP